MEDLNLACKKLRNYDKLTRYCVLVSSLFKAFLDEEIFGKDSDLSKVKYESLLDEKRRDKIQSFLDEPLDPELEKEFDKAWKETERDMGIA